MVACIGLGSERNGTCALPQTSLDLYNAYVISTNIWIKAVATDWCMHTYTASHSALHTYFVCISDPRNMYESRYSSIQSDLGYFIARVGQVVSNANSFYASVSGAAGVMSWLASNIDLGAIGGSLCGHSSPNWCNFSPVATIQFVCYVCNMKCLIVSIEG